MAATLDPVSTLPSPIPYRLGETCVVAGRFAQYRGDDVSNDRPERTYHFAVSNLTMDDYLSQLVGKVPWSPMGNSWTGTVRGSGWSNDVWIKADDWERQAITVPVVPPRNGKTYGWAWGGSYRQWYKVWWPQCSLCYHVHDPAYIECAQCGYCHRDGGKCR